ncbi:outer membrane protein [Rhizobium sp. YIM 134829]|uniref:outer membrane protein n=1 Tax=Rhizobium sp. YIM 134829 TaxID=3390453 RepID=UPI003979C0F2
MMRFTTLLLAGIALAVPASLAAAADLTEPVGPVVVETSGGFYLGSVNTLTFLDDTSFDAAGADIDTDYDVGYYSAVRAGYSFGDMGFVSPRIELEVGYGNASVDQHRVNGAGAGSTDSFGDARQIAGYVNGYLDMPLSGMAAITPYIGGGVGVMNLELRRQGVSGTGVVMDDDDTRFAYHLDAGVGIKLQQLGLFNSVALFDNTTFDIGYRYTAADGFSFTARDGSRSDTDFSSHAVLVGFRKSF